MTCSEDSPAISTKQTDQRLERAALQSIAGPLLITGDGVHLHGLQFVQGAAGIRSLHTAEPLSALMSSALTQLKQYFSGARRQFELPLHLAGTSFQIEVWEMMRTIEFGEQLSYGSLAARLGNKHLARAVGQAANRNPIPIIVPCHRLVGSAGQLGGFAPGVGLKRILLEHEQKHRSLPPK
jgi:methylated-DNA-[protein]-cysteine S-methyltransferase